MLWYGRLGHPKAPGPPKFINHSQILALFHLVERATQSVADMCGVEYLSLVGDPEAREGMFYDDSHYAPEGGRRAAEIIAQMILSPVYASKDDCALSPKASEKARELVVRSYTSFLHSMSHELEKHNPREPATQPAGIGE
jgi:hypothetical protein